MVKLFYIVNACIYDVNTFVSNIFGPFKIILAAQTGSSRC